MKFAFFILIIFINSPVFSQNDTVSYFDSLYNIRDQLNHDKITTYWDSDKKIRSYEFNIENGKVNGLFRYWNKNGILVSIGNYKADSLWTFRNEKFYSDSTYKIGSWMNFYLQNSNDSFYRSAYIKEHLYKIPFDENTYSQYFLNNNDKLWISKTFTRGIKLPVEKRFNELYLDTIEIPYSLQVYNLDDTSPEAMERNDSINKLFGITNTDPDSKYQFLFTEEGKTYIKVIKLLTTCCPDPIGKVYKKGEELILDYSYPENAAFCDALCSYIFIYEFSSKDVANYFRDEKAKIPAIKINTK